MALRNEEFSNWQVNCPDTSQRLAHLLRSQEWTDCVFQFPTTTGAGDSKKSLFAHKLILAMASPVFAAMFYGNVGDKESPVFIGDIDRLTFSALLSYIYTDEADIPDTEAAINLYKAANKYILVHLEKECLDFLFEALKPSNVCLIYEFASFFGEKLLEEKCLEVFSTKTQLVLNSPNFRYADTNTLKKIVSMDTLDINNEMELFNALLDYANNKKFNKSDDSENLASEPSEVKANSEVDLRKSDKQTCNETDDNIARSSENKASNSSVKNPEDARRILKGIIEEIRFLSMTPCDLAKIVESTTVLSKEETNAIFVNMFSPNSSLPMPNGFSCLREPRIRGAATFSHTFHNVTNMIIDQNAYSPPCYVRNLPWRIAVRKSNECLGLYLDCNAKSLPAISPDWSCKAKVELRLLSFNPGTEPIMKKFEHIFYTKEYDQGYSKFLEWRKLIDPDNNYIENDCITVEVHFATEPVKGIDSK